MTYYLHTTPSLIQVEKAMREAVRAALYNAVLTYVDVPRTEWCVSHPAQTILNASQVPL